MAVTWGGIKLETEQLERFLKWFQRPKRKIGPFSASLCCLSLCSVYPDEDGRRLLLRRGNGLEIEGTLMSASKATVRPPPVSVMSCSFLLMFCPSSGLLARYVKMRPGPHSSSSSASIIFSSASLYLSVSLPLPLPLLPTSLKNSCDDDEGVAHKSIQENHLR